MYRLLLNGDKAEKLWSTVLTYHYLLGHFHHCSLPRANARRTLIYMDGLGRFHG